MLQILEVVLERLKPLSGEFASYKRRQEMLKTQGYRDLKILTLAALASQPFPM